MLLDLGITDLFQEDGTYAISARDVSIFFRILYNATYLRRGHSERALSYLANSDFDVGLAAGLPALTPLANKFGDYEDAAAGLRELHDCGIIYTPEKDYALCVMTRGADTQKLAKTIAGVSELVYKEVVD